MNPAFRKYLLQVTHSSACAEKEVIQSLWSGYGKISRYQLVDSLLETVVVKFISPNPTSEHPRGWNTDRSHHRKLKSYEMETNWYEKWNHLCTDNCRTPKFLGSYSEGQDQWIILEDLNVNYPLRKHQLQLSEVKVCLSWLANFHATFISHEPNGLWRVGTYWHLETRPDEFEKMEHEGLKSKAPGIDKILNNCRYQTIIHGDAKLANFCFSENSDKVAAVDFQYVGGGCGMKDVAYFLGSCLSSTDCELYDNELLDFYFSALKKAIESHCNDSISSSINFTELALEWRKMYAYSCADFTRFMLGWMPSHQKVNDYQLKMVELVLKDM